MSRNQTAVPTWRQLWRDTAGALVDPVETRWIIEEVSGLGLPALLRELDRPATPAEVARLAEVVARRLSGEPLQHVLGHWGFRTLEVAVDSRVLVPRPETEFVVEVALSELDRIAAKCPASLFAVDLGTGSGVIALSLAAERDAVRVVAVDRDPGALDVALANLSRLAPQARERVELLAGDWYGALPASYAGRFDLIVANPPYLAEHEWALLDPVVRDFDPVAALVAGPSGLEHISTIVAGAPEWLGTGGRLVVEIAPSQNTAVLSLARCAGIWARIEVDLAGRPRVLVASR